MDTLDLHTNTASAAGTWMLGGNLPVNRVGYGAMRLPGPQVWGEPEDPDTARAVLRRAVAHGVNLVDTAWFYGPYVADRLIVEALHPYPADLVLVTKLGGARGADGSWIAAARPEELRAACEDELRALRRDQFDLVHFRYMGAQHMGESGVPFAESFGAMVDLQREGKIQHLGLSNVTLAELQEAQAMVPVASVQNLYNLVHREAEDVLDACMQDGIAFMPFFPLMVGQVGRAEGAVTAVAAARGATPGQIALAWLLARSPVTVLIPGTSSLAHLDENIAAAAIRLTDAEMASLDGVPAMPNPLAS